MQQTGVLSRLIARRAAKRIARRIARMEHSELEGPGAGLAPSRPMNQHRLRPSAMRACMRPTEHMPTLSYKLSYTGRACTAGRHPPRAVDARGSAGHGLGRCGWHREFGKAREESRLGYRAKSVAQLRVPTERARERTGRQGIRNTAQHRSEVCCEAAHT